jgi:hypothetical protein
VGFVASKWYEEELQKHGYIEVEKTSELEKDLQAVTIKSSMIPELWSKSMVESYRASIAIGAGKLKKLT